MLVASKVRYLPTTINTLILQKDDMYFYVHRDVYDKSVILEDRQSLDSLTNIIKPTNNLDLIRWFYENAPDPVNILAPYLGLVGEELEEDIELLSGVLHVITSVIDVRNYILQPYEMRKSVSFSLSVKEEFEMAWERFFNSSVAYDQRNQVIPYMMAGQVVSSGMTDISQSVPNISEGEYDDGPEKFGPGWTKVSDGVYYNSETDETAFEENDDDDAEFLALLEDDDNEVVKEELAKEEVSQPTSVESTMSDAEKAKTLKMFKM